MKVEASRRGCRAVVGSEVVEEGGRGGRGALSSTDVVPEVEGASKVVGGQSPVEQSSLGVGVVISVFESSVELLVVGGEEAKQVEASFQSES